MKKIHSDRGESLIEVLAAILIASLSVALMFGCIMISTNMDEDAKALDEQYYLDLTAADAQDAAPTPTPDPSPGSTPIPTPTPEPTGNVTIKRVSTSYASAAPTTPPTETPSATLDITIYGEAGMSSYRRTE